MSEDAKLYDVVVDKGRGDVKSIAEAVPYAEAKTIMQDWSSIFNGDVFHDPVPKLKIVGHQKGGH